MSYFTFYVCGASNVVPWLSFILCIDFFNATYPSGMCQFIFPVVSMSMLTIVTIFVLLAGRALPIDGRVYVGFALQLISLVLAPLIQFSTEFSNETSYYLTLLALTGCSLASAIIQSSLYGMASVFGSTFLQASEAGKGAAGVVLVVVRCLTKYYLNDHPLQAVIYFFGVSIVTTGFAIGLYAILHRLEYAAPLLNEYKSVQRQTPVTPTRITETTELLFDQEAQETTVDVKSVFQKVLKPVVMVFMTYSICLGCFPGLTTSIRSITFNLGDWLPVILVAAYNLGDMIGKSLPAYYMFLTVETLHRPLYLQLLFIPLLFIDVIHPVGDVFTIGLVLALGIVTGYTGTCGLMMIPTLCQETEKEMAGIIGSLALILGLFVGSYIGIGLDYLLKS